MDKIHYVNADLTRRPHYTACNMFRFEQESTLPASAGVTWTRDGDSVTCVNCLRRMNAERPNTSKAINLTRDEREFVRVGLETLIAAAATGLLGWVIPPAVKTALDKVNKSLVPR